MSKLSKEDLSKAKLRNKKYREKTLNKTKKFLSVRVSKKEGEEIKMFMKENNIPIKKLIELGTEIMWEEIK